MANDRAKPSYNAKRRIQFLFAFSVFLIIAATAAWYFVAGKIDEVAGNVIAQQRTQGTRIECPNRAVKGYPFRFGVFCDSLRVSVGSRGPSFTAGELRSAAQFYDPNKVLVELDSPASLNGFSPQPVMLNWENLRASIVAGEPIPETFSLVATQADAAVMGETLRTENIELHFRTVGRDLDLAGRTDAIRYNGSARQFSSLPALGIDFNLRFADGVAFVASGQQRLRNVSGTLNRAALLLTADQGALLSGPFSIDGQGLLDAELKLRIVDVDGVIKVAGEAFPDIAPLMTAFMQGQPRTGEKGDEVELTIMIVQGQARMGLIPLGSIPPF